jgi:signal peptidase I
MQFDFELILTLIVLISGLVWLVDALFFARKRAQATDTPMLVEYAKSFFPVLLLVLVLRSFLFEPYRIPSGSDEPTLLIGDFIVANKFAYGVRLPVTHNKIIDSGDPKIGDIALFRYPVDPSQNFIKRVIGIPGDHISYINKVLYINGKEASQKYLGVATDKDEAGQEWPVTMLSENLNGVQHNIYVRPDVPVQDFSLTVPPGEYFMMGDNRDNSNDSRYWGFVPEANLIGKAFAVLFSWNADHGSARWSRMGTEIQ